jgi:hypothetical protein
MDSSLLFYEMCWENSEPGTLFYEMCRENSEPSSIRSSDPKKISDDLGRNILAINVYVDLSWAVQAAEA